MLNLLHDSFWMILFFAIAIFIGYFVHFILFRILKRITDYTTINLDKYLVKHLKDPVRLFFIIIAIRTAISLLQTPISPEIYAFLQSFLYFITLFAIGWSIVKLISVFEDFLIQKYRMDEKDNLFARKIHTQFMVFKHLGIIIVAIVIISVALLRFESVRTLGTGLLTSVGIMGIVVGLAAQKTGAALIAGIQIAFSQPIRIDDVVIVENEWGRVEEINFTYVVVKIWDSRRLIVPTSYFLEHPFENWTKTSSDMLGTVFLYVDYRLPVDELRHELLNILDQSPWWDKRVSALQVTDSKETTMELRALMSVADSSSAWELRCEVREKLITFIQKNYPECLPRLRITAESISKYAEE
ncbi:mechanosensitive ion channel family protein [Atribacter laminatus]|uniref:Miniconductance mechanosensitive channel MscM n=1 Tax=Atribacter laminatus TaxID=2847778 RepID=A0A7T1F3Y6_ATRLM|nr:mechanosensitive ion channel domain-containing protein [Atribacter laminatus]QPM68875.1 Miniconductance mechanosensitive channel MscM [Atribacter laminatus]